MRRQKKQNNPWEWIVAILVGVLVTLICVIRQVTPPTVLFRVVFAVCSVAAISKIAASSIRLLLANSAR